MIINYLNYLSVNKNYFFYLKTLLSGANCRLCFCLIIATFAYTAVFAQSGTLNPVADSYTRNGTYGSDNYGNDTSLLIKGSSSSGYARFTYLKFSLGSLTNISSAKLRLYGRNTSNSSAISVSSYGVTDDSWLETGITFNNAPAASSTALGSATVSDEAKYYEFDVTGYVISQSNGDNVVSFLVKDPSNQNSNLSFNSRENGSNAPQLVISTSGTAEPSNALLFVENLDRFPANDNFVASRVQIPWTRDNKNYNTNHDSLTVRIHNKGISFLTLNDLTLSSTSRWKIEKLNGVAYTPGSGLPLTINSGTYADVTIRFIAVDQATRIKVIHDTLTISSNDDKFPAKIVYLNGMWQKKGEGSNEPYAQEVINTFGYKTSTGFSHTDPDRGDTAKLKGSEVRPSYFVRADSTRPISIRQMSAYHGCCVQSEKISWYLKGTTTLNTIFVHAAKDAQSVLQRKNGSASFAEGSFSSSGIFGFQVGYNDRTDASKNPGGKTGIRVWKALDAAGKIIPNTYLISNDYLGTSNTNYDYNDNMYYVKNVKPEKGSAFYSELSPSPSALDFNEKILQSDNSLALNLASLGKTYSNGSSDPAITISSIAITGENSSEFSAVMPSKTVLNPQENTTLTVKFNPTSQGLKIADLLIYYNNSQSPVRVPLYGIAKATGVTVTANYRINSGSSTPITINGKTWAADNQYSFDNLEPYTNPRLHEIAGTDDDPLYLKEQSSNGDKKPFRYQFPVSNGDYVVRLHFAEIYWGAPGSGINGGAGSRVMSVSIENELRLTNLDVSQEVGGATILIKNLPVTVTDGKLNINFSATVNRPMVVAVEVYSFRSAALAKPVNIVNAAANPDLNKARIYPNPVQKDFIIEFPHNYSGKSNLQIIDATGRVYDAGTVRLQPGSSLAKVNVSNLSLTEGFYYLKIVSETRPTEIIKLIIQ